MKLLADGFAWRFDQDLMCRMYMVTKFHFIDEPLYVYRYAINTFCKTGINEKIPAA